MLLILRPTQTIRINTAFVFKSVSQTGKGREIHTNSTAQWQIQRHFVFLQCKCVSEGWPQEQLCTLASTGFYQHPRVKQATRRRYVSILVRDEHVAEHDAQQKTVSINSGLDPFQISTAMAAKVSVLFFLSFFLCFLSCPLVSIQFQVRTIPCTCSSSAPYHSSTANLEPFTLLTG